MVTVGTGARLVDISSNQPHPIDFAKVKASGISAVFVKATQGTGYTNQFYAGDIAAARAAGLQVAGYHFKGTGTAQAEAAYFHSVAGADAKILDVETSTDVAWIDAFLVALNEPSSEELTYGSASTLPHNINRGLLFPAAYGPTDPHDPNEVVWQYSQTSQVPGITGDVDESEWTGTQAQWDAFFGLIPTPTGEGFDMVLTDTKSGGVWVADASGAVYAYDGAPYLGATNNHQINPGGWPCVGICSDVNAKGPGYCLVLDSGPQPAGTDRYRRYRFYRS